MKIFHTSKTLVGTYSRMHDIERFDFNAFIAALKEKHMQSQLTLDLEQRMDNE